MKERGGAVIQNWVPLSHISPTLRRAVIVAEDDVFYDHRGVDFRAVRESFLRNLRTLRWARGFSTISMQVAKNLYLSQNKSLTRKILELMITQKVERTLPKNRILEIYLNIIEWGDHIYGAEAASRHYFKKSAAGLAPEEAAFLAAIIPSPRRWGRWPPSPVVARRQRTILRRMGYGPQPRPNEEIPELPSEPPSALPETLPETAPETSPETAPQSPQLTPIPENL